MTDQQAKQARWSRIASRSGRCGAGSSSLHLRGALRVGDDTGPLDMRVPLTGRRERGGSPPRQRERRSPGWRGFPGRARGTCARLRPSTSRRSFSTWCGRRGAVGTAEQPNQPGPAHEAADDGDETSEDHDEVVAGVGVMAAHESAPFAISSRTSAWHGASSGHQHARSRPRSGVSQASNWSSCSYWNSARNLRNERTAAQGPGRTGTRSGRAWRGRPAARPCRRAGRRLLPCIARRGGRGTGSPSTRPTHVDGALRHPPALGPLALDPLRHGHGPAPRHAAFASRYSAAAASMSSQSWIASSSWPSYSDLPRVDIMWTGSYVSMSTKVRSARWNARAQSCGAWRVIAW
uniref:Phosphoprotein n=1 Tax=Wheat rosette stunt virus TaxID=75890 RepID=Q9JFR9_9RHAB|nr:phosphoprotein [Wheat rosette stunt virus]